MDTPRAKSVPKFVWSGVLNVALKITLWLLQAVFVVGAVLMRMQVKTHLTQSVKPPKMGKVERKLEVERMLVTVKAILTKDVSFQTNTGVVFLNEGDEIRLDPEDNIGYYGGYHFDVKNDEYKIAFLN